VNRRTFLKGSGLLLGASFIGASRAIGAEERIAPSERITVGLVGVGKMGHGHLGSLLSEGDVQLVAVCDVWQDRLQAAQESVEAHYAEEKRSGSFKGCSATTDFMEVVEREDIDAVLTATPDHWHALVAAHAARAGKDVYCEKPLTRTIAEARTLADTVKQYGCVFQTGSQQRSSREFRLACEMVRNGRIGKVHTVHVNAILPRNPRLRSWTGTDGWDPRLGVPTTKFSPLPHRERNGRVGGTIGTTQGEV